MAKAAATYTATVHGRPVLCRFCDANTYTMRNLKMNTAGAEFFGFAWANAESTALFCTGCGAIQEFVPGVLKLEPVA